MKYMVMIPALTMNLRKSIQNAVSSISPTKLKMFDRCEASCRAEENNFQYRL